LHVDQGGRADEEELQHPVADVGDGEGLVVADIGAAWLGPRLLGVAVKVFLLVPPHTLRGHHVDQHAEDEHHGQPDAPEGCGVLVDSAQQGLERLPVHELVCWQEGNAHLLITIIITY
uniref:Uncharacterized protein n=1 Tax=Capra hircus TaxID=9925 RepID=A0A8C2QYD4_CAPHI